MNSSYYWFTNKSTISLAENLKRLHGLVNTFQDPFKNTNFSGGDPTMVADFLTRFVSEAEKLGDYRAHTLVRILVVFNGREK